MIASEITRLVGSEYMFNDRVNERYTLLVPTLSSTGIMKLENLGCRVRGCDFIPENLRLGIPYEFNQLDGIVAPLSEERKLGFITQLVQSMGKKLLGSYYINIPAEYVDEKAASLDPSVLAPDLPKQYSSIFEIQGTEINQRKAYTMLTESMNSLFPDVTYGITGVESSTHITVLCFSIKESREFAKRADYTDSFSFPVESSKIKDDLTAPSAQFFYEAGPLKYRNEVTPIIHNGFTYEIERLKELLDARTD